MALTGDKESGAEPAALDGLTLPLEWSVSLGHRDRKKQRIVIVVAFFAGVLGMFVLRSPLGFVCGVLVVMLSTLEVFFPIKYKLDREEASSRLAFSVTSLRWESVKRVVNVEGGVRLSPLTKPSRLDNSRGVLLRFSGNEDEVLATIAALTNDGSVLDRGVDSGGGGEVDRQGGA